MAKKNFYVIWNGHQTGVFSSWNECKKHIANFKGAQYKSFSSQNEAEKAHQGKYEDYINKDNNKIALSPEKLKQIGKPILTSISVDAACSGNPGIMEYRGVDTKTKKELFKNGPFESGTNNIGEFLALVHGLSYLKRHGLQMPIYSDSKIAIGWVKKGQCRTSLPITPENRALFDLVIRAEKWLENNKITIPILKWETKAWGEIPADFGRK